MQSINRIKGVTETLNTGEVMVWKGPDIWCLYQNAEIVDSSRRASGMTTEQAHAYSKKHTAKQQLATSPA